MVAYNFQSEFVTPIVSGRKRSTIRAPRKNKHAGAGDDVQLFVGQRTPDCLLLLRAPCIRQAKISLFRDCVIMDGIRRKQPKFLGHLARGEGFDAWADMVDWYAAHYGDFPIRNLVFVMWDYGRADFVAGAIDPAKSGAQGAIGG